MGNDARTPQKQKNKTMAYYLYKDGSGQFRWRLQAGNNRIIANSGEAYHNKQDCLAAINLVKGSGTAPVYEV